MVGHKERTLSEIEGRHMQKPVCKIKLPIFSIHKTAAKLVFLFYLCLLCLLAKVNSVN